MPWCRVFDSSDFVNFHDYSRHRVRGVAFPIPAVIQSQESIVQLYVDPVHSEVGLLRYESEDSTKVDVLGVGRRIDAVHACALGI